MKSSSGRCRFTPHTVPLEGGVRSVTDATHLHLLLTQPDADARAAGSRAFYAGLSREQNPHPVLTAAYASWDAGWYAERQESS